ncbi:MAG: DUF2313 domain-containing protein [Lachnospiraceae bacterium]|nr:DUF2313 domain-containing protein [Lachnospiraceae bacterium]
MKYGDLQYGSDAGIQLYGDSEIITVQEDPTAEGYVDLERYVPEFIKSMKEFHEWLVAQGYEVGSEWELVKLIKKQLFAYTVDTEWGCLLWEKLLGLQAAEAETIEQRRSSIIAKLRTTQTCTPELLKAITEELTGVTCTIIEDNPHYSFVIQFVGQYGVVKNVRAVKARVDEIKPAHLAYEILFRYVLWKELTGYTWNDISIYTWDGLRILAIILHVTWKGLLNAPYTWKTIKAQNWITVTNLEDAKT